MRIAFVDVSEADYNVESAYKIPLGGSHSAICYLSEALAHQGHDVYLWNRTSTPGRFNHVTCLSLNDVPLANARSLKLDVLVIFREARLGLELRPLLDTKTQLVFWSQDSDISPQVLPLQDFEKRNVYDGIALVSNWQRNKFCLKFSLDPFRTRVLRNAISPTFSHLFDSNQKILIEKRSPPVLGYTSTPFRGLGLLLDMFPHIRQAVPGTTLKVFSSLKVYQVAQATEDAYFGELYRRCREMEGVEYVGSISQVELAQELRSITALTYPNTFLETSCIAVMEALASGCHVITSDLAALPETTVGLATLVPVDGNWQTYKNNFIDATLQVLTQHRDSDSANLEALLTEQVRYIGNFCTWSVRAHQWVQWLQELSSNRLDSVEQELMSRCSLRLKSWQEQAYEFLLAGDFKQATQLYEQAIELDSLEQSNYWYLGLSLLLQGQEEEAQVTWMMSLMQEDSPEESQIGKLVEFLKIEAALQESLLNKKSAWLIRQHIEAIANSVQDE